MALVEYETAKAALAALLDCPKGCPTQADVDSDVVKYEAAKAAMVALVKRLDDPAPIDMESLVVIAKEDALAESALAIRANAERKLGFVLAAIKNTAGRGRAGSSKLSAN